MNKVPLLITFAAIVLCCFVSSCAKQNDYDGYVETTGKRFGTVDEQAAYLNGVMETIGAEQELLGTFLDTLQTASDSFASEVDSLMEDLDGRMQAVHDSLKGYTKKTELEATFATLASVDTLSGVLAAIEVKLKSDSLVLTAALKNSIKATEDSLTAKFKSYYKKGELDALLAAQSRRMDTLSANADSAAKEIGIIRESIAELQKRYAGISSTLNSRIDELKKTDGDIETSIKELDNDISKELESLKPKVAANTAAITALEARVRKLEIRVQSIEVVPEYADGSVDMKKGSTAIRFEVRPRYLIDSLAGKPGLFSFQIIKTAAATKAGIFADTITVLSVNKSAEDSLLTVAVDGTEMPADFFAGTQTYSARLSLSDGNTDRTSAYFPLTPPIAFSVSDTKQVLFSKGNLYWDGTAFKFEDNQYSSDTTWDEKHVSHFLWSKTASFAYAESYNDPSAALGDVFFTNSTVTTPNPSFTVAGETGVWRTLSGGKDGEWDYLLFSRKVNGGTGEGKSWQRATIRSDASGGVFGLIIYPDAYKFQKSKEVISYNSAEWSAMESAGCVFLPAAGYRESASVKTAGSYGNYWASSEDAGDVENAAYLFFSSKDIIPQGAAFRSDGNSVRLVTDVK